MKILNLEVKNIRGIKRFKIEPRGKNFVVYGPNGTGKSAIIDAIDFLLTGEISRLTGEGTKTLSLKAHGPHVDSRKKLENTRVSSKIEVKGKEAILERSIKKPSFLKVTPKEHKTLIEPYLKIAKLGLHILCRKDILKYVTAEAGKRAKEVMSLLNLQNIENIRTNLVTIKNDAIQTFIQTKSKFDFSKNDVCKLLSLDDFSEKAVLSKVNELRKILGGSIINKLLSVNIREGLLPYPYGPEKVLTREQVTNTINEVRILLHQKDSILSDEFKLKKILNDAIKEKKFEQSLIYSELFETGFTLTESNVCPLCGRKWEKGSFKEYLKKKKQKIVASKRKQKKIMELSTSISSRLGRLRSDIDNCIEAHKDFNLKLIDQKTFSQFFSKFDSWHEALNNPYETLRGKKWPSNLHLLFDSDFLEESVLAPLEKASKFIKEQFSPKQMAWDTLTRMEDYCVRYQEAKKEKKNVELFKKRTEAILDHFENARDTILEQIYNTMKSDFDKFYKMIHQDEETHFSSKFLHKGPELNLEVDFYRRGMFPPHALHSEGHQDCMGICLFFALNKFLVEEGLSIILLDDVIMSIDNTHRRGICQLLTTIFSEKQYFITTHENSWAKQLKTEGVVSEKNMIHFVNWKIEIGPTYELEKDLWDRINEDLEKDDIPSAAYKLRRNAEYFFDNVCDSLEAAVPYRASHRWELGHFANAAISTYKRYIRRAIVNFKKLNLEDKLTELNELNEKATKIITLSRIEQWIINENVHYNRWKEFSMNDFKPVVKAFKELFNLFICDCCGAMISLIQTKGKTPKKTVICKCSKIVWNVQ